MEINYRKKHGNIRIKLLDETIKKFQVDFSISVSSVVEFIADKMSLPNAEEFSLHPERADGKSNPLYYCLLTLKSGMAESPTITIRTTLSRRCLTNIEEEVLLFRRKHQS